MTKKRRIKFHRGIMYELNGPYSIGRNRCVIFMPDIEVYSKSTAGVKAYIDKNFNHAQKVRQEGIEKFGF